MLAMSTASARMRWVVEGDVGRGVLGASAGMPESQRTGQTLSRGPGRKRQPAPFHL